jgi:hypothetical protein
MIRGLPKKLGLLMPGLLMLGLLMLGLARLQPWIHSRQRFSRAKPRQVADV